MTPFLQCVCVLQGDGDFAGHARAVDTADGRCPGNDALTPYLHLRMTSSGWDTESGGIRGPNPHVSPLQAKVTGSALSELVASAESSPGAPHSPATRAGSSPRKSKARIALLSPSSPSRGSPSFKGKVSPAKAPSPLSTSRIPRASFSRGPPPF